MPFYEQLSPAYDALFPVSSSQRALLRSMGEESPGLSVLDAGCGSGSQLLPLVESGALCTGLEPDPALAALATRKLSPFGNVRIETAGFSDMGRIASPGSLDLVLCLGNSLVHVPQDEASRFLSDAATALLPGGKLLLQILNYDRFTPEGETELSPLRSADGELSMKRRYRWESDRKLRFLTELTMPGDPPRVRPNDIPLYPIRPPELAEMLSAAGFKSVEYFADFSLSAFSHDSEALVCLARKP